MDQPKTISVVVWLRQQFTWTAILTFSLLILLLWLLPTPALREMKLPEGTTIDGASSDGKYLLAHQGEEIQLLNSSNGLVTDKLKAPKHGAPATNETVAAKLCWLSADHHYLGYIVEYAFGRVFNTSAGFSAQQIDSRYHYLHLLDRSTGKEIPLEQRFDWDECTISPDGKYLAFASFLRGLDFEIEKRTGIHIQEIATSKTWHLCNKDQNIKLTWGYGPHTLFALTDDKKLRAWDVLTQNQILTAILTFPKSGKYIDNYQFKASPDNRSICINSTNAYYSGDGNFILVWDTLNQKQICYEEFPQDLTIFNLAVLSHDLLAVCQTERTGLFALWRLFSNDEPYGWASNSVTRQPTRLMHLSSHSESAGPPVEWYSNIVLLPDRTTVVEYGSNYLRWRSLVPGWNWLYSASIALGLMGFMLVIRSLGSLKKPQSVP